MVEPGHISAFSFHHLLWDSKSFLNANQWNLIFKKHWSSIVANYSLLERKRIDIIYYVALNIQTNLLQTIGDLQFCSQHRSYIKLVELFMHFSKQVSN